jgi:hypothetical protein
MTDLSIQLRRLDGELLMEQIVGNSGAAEIIPITLGRVCAAALIQAGRMSTSSTRSRS